MEISGRKNKAEADCDRGRTHEGEDETLMVGLNRNSSCSLEESVFLIDHILESIVSGLDRETLLSCRLVSLRWANFAAKELQNTVDIVIEPYGYIYPPSCLKKLILLMYKSMEFPSSTFTFRNYKLSRLNPKPLFKAHGPSIKKLKLFGSAPVTLNNVKRLLFTQAPNIQQLILSMSDDSDILVYMPPKERATKKGPHVDETLVCPQPTLPTLRVFKCSKHIPQLFVQHLLEWSPNLIEVALPLEYIHLLVKPINRIHLLKELRTVKSLKDRAIEVLECVANHHEDNLALEEIQFGHFRTPEDVKIKILKGSSATCQKLGLDYEFDFEKLPQMPQVKHLSIHGFWHYPCPVNLFERWTLLGLGDTFPNLRSLGIMICSYTQDARTDDLFGQRVPEGIASVKDVTFSPHIQPREALLPKLENMFPNATFRTLMKYELDTEDKWELQYRNTMPPPPIDRGDVLHFNPNV